MNKQTNKLPNPEELRNVAEQKLEAHFDHKTEDQLFTDGKSLLHELQVHQIELKMQNEALRESLAKTQEARAAAEIAQQRYLELFDFAPVAYLIVEENGIIRNTNFRAAVLLESERATLAGQYFSQYVSNEYRAIFNRFIEQVFTSGKRCRIEITLQINKKPFYVAIEGIIDESRNSCLMAVLDISDCKQKEQNLIENNAFITDILNSLPSQIAVLDKQGVIIAVNNACVDFDDKNALPILNPNVIGFNFLDTCKTDLDHFSCEQADQIYTGIGEILRGERRVFTREYTCHTAEQQRWFQMTVSPLKAPRYGALVTNVNITQRKLSDRMPNLLKAMFDISMDGFWEFDMAGNLISVNEAYAKMSGYTIDELSHMHISQLEVIEDAEQIKTHLAKLLKHGYDQFETSHRHKDGHIIDVEIAAAYLSEFGQYCAFCRDISQRKKTEGILNAVFDASSEGIISFDLYNSIVSTNPAIETIFGYQPAELIGGSIGTLIPFLVKYRNKCNCHNSLEKREAQIIEVEGLHKLGSKIPLEMSKTVYKFNNACYFVIIVRDISQRKKREHEDKKHLDELAHITRLGLMGEMASGIAHEVNQPLTAICSYTQAAINLLNTEQYNPANLAEILYKTQQQSFRAGQIIHRMREFIKSNPKQRSTIEINTLVREASNLCEDEIKQNNVKLAFGLEENIPPVNADHIQIEQVLINLIRNSIEVLQHLPKNQPRQLSIQTQLIDNSIIQVRVKDNGPGIDEEQKLKVLTPFYTTKNTGMGMGLSICRSLIEAHDGVLFFNSEVGKGSTFYFELPLNYEKN